MDGKYLVINSGSSSVKFSLYEIPGQRLVAKGNVERIGKNNCSWIIKTDDKKIKNGRFLNSHVDAVRVILDELLNNSILTNLNEIKGVGHRVLHGGSFYDNSVLIDDDVLKNIKMLTPLGPMHHPGEIAGIECMMELLPNIPQVAVFDTAFHQTMPEANYMYPVPIEWYTKYGVRRYGFHGTSHKYITKYMQKLFNRDSVNLIICHIGSGASISAIKNGVCYDTSMGLTPLDGLMMGTRSGSIDPSIINYVKVKSGKKVNELNQELNEKSGLLGITGKNDYRDVEKAALEGDHKAILALQMFSGSIVKYIGQYYTELEGNVDGIVFTAGIGENSSNFRKMIIDKISKPFGIVLDNDENSEIASFKDKNAGIISTDESHINVFVIPTDEEKMIMLDTYNIVKENAKTKSI